MTPSPELAAAADFPRFWSDWYTLGESQPGAYDSVAGGRATFRAGDDTLALRFHASGYTDGPLGRASLAINNTPVGFVDFAGPHVRAGLYPYALRWIELETIAQCAAIRDRQPPAFAIALLARFTPICLGDDADRCHAIVAAALGAHRVPADTIDDAIAAIDLRAAGVSWHRGATGWSLEQVADDARLSGIDIHDEGQGATWRTRGGNFDALHRLVDAAHDVTMTARGGTERAVALARAIVGGDAAAASVLADALLEAGVDNPAILGALAEPPSPGRSAWVAELVASVPAGATRFPPSPFSPMARHVYVDAPPAAMAALRDDKLGRWWGRRGACLRLARGRDLGASLDAIERVVTGTGATIAWYDDRWHVTSP